MIFFFFFWLFQPPGRPIPVETGSGERQPSVDTRAPRMRDLDAIIEVEHVSNLSLFWFLLVRHSCML